MDTRQKQRSDARKSRAGRLTHPKGGEKKDTGDTGSFSNAKNNRRTWIAKKIPKHHLQTPAQRKCHAAKDDSQQQTSASDVNRGGKPSSLDRMWQENTLQKGKRFSEQGLRESDRWNLVPAWKGKAAGKQ